MTIEKAQEAAIRCQLCESCLLCQQMTDAMDDFISIVSCHDCIYFEPGETERFGWCRNCRCKKHPYGFCDEGLKKEKAE